MSQHWLKKPPNETQISQAHNGWFWTKVRSNFNDPGFPEIDFIKPIQITYSDNGRKCRFGPGARRGKRWVPLTDKAAWGGVEWQAIPAPKDLPKEWA